MKKSLQAMDSVAVDSSYKSDENYRWFELPPETAPYGKPRNHEMAKHKKDRTDISIRKNMAYDTQADRYTYANGRLLKKCGERKRIQPQDWKSPHRSMNAANVQRPAQRKVYPCMRQ